MGWLIMQTITAILLLRSVVVGESIDVIIFYIAAFIFSAHCAKKEM